MVMSEQPTNSASSACVKSNLLRRSFTHCANVLTGADCIWVVGIQVCRVHFTKGGGGSKPRLWSLRLIVRLRGQCLRRRKPTLG
jgi:hypothetical protein